METRLLLKLNQRRADMEYKTRKEMYEAHKARRRRMAEAAARYEQMKAEKNKPKLPPPPPEPVPPPISAEELAEKKLKEFFNQAPKKILSITDKYKLVVNIEPDQRIALFDIVHDVCRRRGLTKQMVMSKSRQREIVWARWEIWYLARNNMSLSLPVIGKRTGGFDHTTVLHGVRNFKKLLDAGKVTLEITIKTSQDLVDANQI